METVGLCPYIHHLAGPISDANIGVDEEPHSSIAEFCMKGLDITTPFCNLGKFREHVRPGNPDMIKSREAIILPGHACGECVR